MSKSTHEPVMRSDEGCVVDMDDDGVLLTIGSEVTVRVPRGRYLVCFSVDRVRHDPEGR